MPVYFILVQNLKQHLMFSLICITESRSLKIRFMMAVSLLAALTKNILNCSITATKSITREILITFSLIAQTIILKSIFQKRISKRDRQKKTGMILLSDRHCFLILTSYRSQCKCTPGTSPKSLTSVLSLKK